jgi:hypothetical protein
MRRRGIGGQLLVRCEMLAARTGRARIATYFSSILPEAAAFMATLATAGWSSPRMMELRYAARCTTFAASIAAWPAMRRRLSAQDVTFEGWSDRSPVDEREIAALASSAECPPGLAPDQWEREIDDDASFVMRRSSHVVGWILARLDSPSEPGAPPVLFVPCAYIRRDLWRSGLLVLAYHFVACRHAELFGDEAVGRFSTAAQFPGMMALTRRRFAPAALWVDEWLRADKPLG